MMRAEGSRGGEYMNNIALHEINTFYGFPMPQMGKYSPQVFPQRVWNSNFLEQAYYWRAN